MERRDFIKTTGIALGTAAVGTTAGATTGTDSTVNGEFRAYWADAFNPGIYSPSEVDQLVESVQDANLNAIIAQVVRRADAFANDIQPPRTDAPIDPEPYDPLETLVERAHDAGIEVHAWININTMWNQADPPTSDDHVFNKHGPDSDDPWISYQVDGEDGSGSVDAERAEEDQTGISHEYYFDPGHPDVVDYHVKTARSIVENYDVDGINLDFIRYPDYQIGWATYINHWGYNPVAIERFQNATGRTDVPDPEDEEWSQWRMDQVTNLLRRIYLETYTLDPSVTISTDAVTYAQGPEEEGGFEKTRTYNEVLQDWRSWMEEGIIDLNVPMNYKAESNEDEAYQYRDWSEFTADHQYNRHAVVGSALYENTVEDSITQIRAALEPTDAGNEVIGWTGYSYATPATDAGRDELERALIEESEYDEEEPPVFEEPATVPEMGWKTNPETGHLQGSVETREHEPVDALSVSVFRRGETVATTTTTGNGWFGVVGLEPGRYRVQVPPEETRGRPIENVTVSAGSVADADFELVGRK